MAVSWAIPFGRNKPTLSILFPSQVPPTGEPLKATAIGWSHKAVSCPALTVGDILSFIVTELLLIQPKLSVAVRVKVSVPFIS